MRISWLRWIDRGGHDEPGGCVPNSFSCPTDTTPRTPAARTATINAYYVCGPAGSFTPPDNFGCVTAIQHFPGDARDGYEPNRPFTHNGF